MSADAGSQCIRGGYKGGSSPPYSHNAHGQQIFDMNQGAEEEKKGG